jgi:toxin ParE1/3/4
MTGYRLSQQAAQDYREILTFTLSKWGVTQFEAYSSLLDKTFERLVRLPLLGIRRDDIRPGFYRYQVGQHYVFYRMGSENLEIARILHIRRKATANLFNDLMF